MRRLHNKRKVTKTQQQYKKRDIKMSKILSNPYGNVVKIE